MINGASWSAIGRIDEIKRNEHRKSSTKTKEKNRSSSMFSPKVQSTLDKHFPSSLPSKRLHIKQTSDAACLTDLCSNLEIDEVEIFSLIKEHIPKYKIRADNITTFAGTTNQDFEFVQFPALNIPDNIGLGLNPDQIRETLNYFLLSGKRCSEMSIVYDDIQAVTRLLQEKEKDLELTVHIGKELLSQNNQLEKKVADLEADLKAAQENIAQINHELLQKNELINILTETDEVNNEVVSPTASKSLNFNFDVLQRKINVLENENRTLHSEVAQVVKETDEVEEQERRLFIELSEQLSSTNHQFEGLTLEIERYKEENRLQNEQIVNLSARLSDTQQRLHELITENDETASVLNITKENQNMLVSELQDYKEKYQETLGLLQETQNLLREKKKRAQPLARNSYVPGLPAPYNAESLQTELMESSLFSENNSLDSGIHSDNGQTKTVPMFKKVFETVKCAGKSNAFKNSDMLSMSNSTELITSQPRMSSSIYSSSSDTEKSIDKLGSYSMYSSIYGNIGVGLKLDDNFISSDSDDGYTNRTTSGVPGCPGAKDLETALKNLSSAEILARRTMLSHAPAGTYSYDDPMTPESIFSRSTSTTLSQYRYPKRLEIVKPLEGSYTLNHWKGLATPAMSGLLHDNERVKVRGEKGLDELGMQLYSLLDVEEDIDELPGKQFDTSPCIYTYTNSCVMHPDDGTSSITFSLPPSQLSSRVESRQTTCPSTPRSLSRRNSCSTFSVSLGLAFMLNERGIKAVTPSCLNTPAGVNFSPTVTPCNSPDGRLSPISGHYDVTETSLTSFLTSSAGVLRKKSDNGQESSSRSSILLEKRAKMRSIRLIQQGENLGIENILSTSSKLVSPLALHSSNIYTRYNSPMAQLTSLKHLSEKNKKIDENEKETTNENMSTTDTSVSTSSAVVRSKQKMQRSRSRRNLNGGQRRDLGTVNNIKREKSDNEKVEEEKSLVGGFVGSISSIFFGRKGGLL
ncbi:CLUMA_CG013630, isoform B [Clunio marinus]|uniref:CLUMA_CG013630, isoform B n=1 Tax=Clunio marinus TaxID=568069 RepID=A0A1J1IJD6_9DIPT|nr:CLUMA_CG013630, isoform B [Clunio marinus]